jgi:NTE family protein
VPGRTRIALALGGGGARGYAHIGVIEALEERGYELVSIAGTSMGALVGGLHAAGVLPGYAEWARSLTQRDVLRLLDPSLSAPGVIRAERVLARVSELLDGALIEELPIPFTAVATDLLAGREVWFQKGPVDIAIRASIALPSVITPVVINGRLLVDGGLMNPIPIAPTTSAHADLVVAVSLAGDRRGTHDGVPVQESAEQRPTAEWFERFRRSAAQILDYDMVAMVASRFGVGRASATQPIPAADELVGALPQGLRKFDVMNLSIDAMQSVITRYRLAGYPPDVLITVPRDACRTLDFHKAGQMIELGRNLAFEALDHADLTGS